MALLEGGYDKRCRENSRERSGIVNEGAGNVQAETEFSNEE